jgi:hypothetical protein
VGFRLNGEPIPDEHHPAFAALILLIDVPVRRHKPRLQDYGGRGCSTAREGRDRKTIAFARQSSYKRKVKGPPMQLECPIKRDARIDVMRGLALLMIFVDHIPGNWLSFVTLHNFGFSDAAEVFVLLAGFSSMLAYGKIFEREGTLSGMRRIMLRLGRIYLFQIGLLLITLGVVLVWTKQTQLQPLITAPILNAPLAGLTHALTLSAVPNYLDILPLYIMLLAVFPLIYLGLRENAWLALGFSAAVWLAANLNPNLNLPNWMDGGSWFFNPFAWQFLFTIGAALAMLSAAHDGMLPRAKWLAWLCVCYLCVGFLQSAPWIDWHLPNMQPFSMEPPDKTQLSVFRLLGMLALIYLFLGYAEMSALARTCPRLLRLLDACGRHSLEVFAVGCVLALVGRLLFRTVGSGFVTQIGVNVIGLAMMCWAGFWLERRRAQPSPNPLIAAH